MKDLENCDRSGMTVEKKTSWNIFYPRTSQEATIFGKVREEIDSFEFRPGTMDDAFGGHLALTGRGSLMLALLKRNFILYFRNRSGVFFSLLVLISFLLYIIF